MDVPHVSEIEICYRARNFVWSGVTRCNRTESPCYANKKRICVTQELLDRWDKLLVISERRVNAPM